MPRPINLLLVHPSEEMCQEFQRQFQTLPNTRIFQERFENLPPHDCFVTAANSFGIMNAGIDAAVVQFHGTELMKNIQYRILDEFLGEQPVGTSLIQPTNNTKYPFVAHSPTMRVPGSIVGTDNIYRATWASFLAIYKHNISKAAAPIRTAAFPAMGAGFGGVSFSEVARQMSIAFDHYLHPPHRLNWDTVTRRHKKIAYNGSKLAVKYSS